MLSTFTILLFLCQVSTLYSKILCNDSDHLRRIRTPGDIIIGGILPIHGRVELINRTQPGPAHCSEFDISTFIQAQAMVYSINQINNSTLLPGIKLGYEIYDSCSDVINAVEATMQLISKLNSSINSVEVHCNYSAYLPRIKAVVGGVYSEISIVIARLLNLYLIPQISYSSSAEILSNKEKFASFFRTIPSDKHQTFAMIQLILYLNWNWVAVISTEDDYGQSAMNSFILHAEKHSICVDFHTLLPVHNSELFKAKINETAQKIQNSTAQVMVTFIRSTDITALFKLLIEKKVNKTWIASDAWSSSRTISTLKQIEKIGTILGFSFKDGKISNFKQYLEKLVMHSKNVDKFTEEFLSITNNRNGTQTGKKLQFKKSHEYEKINANINEAFTYGVYLTIHAITHALRRMLNCDYKKCNRNFDFPPWQLINELKNVSFSTENGNFQFDNSGDYSSGYDIINWRWVNGCTQFDKVGHYNVIKKMISINADFKKNAQFGSFRCSHTCKPGERKGISPENNCCYHCSSCPSGTYSNQNDSTECLNCSEYYWSNAGSSTCQKSTREFIQWSDALSVVLIIIAILGMLIICVVSVLVTKYLSTPAVKAAGGWMCYIMLFSLLISLVSSILFIGEPLNLICRIRQPLYSISFTLCVSCILLKSFRIILAFSFNPIVHKHLKRFYKPVPILIVTTGVQVIICSVSLFLNLPKIVENRDDPKIILMLCDEGSHAAFGITLGYIALLSCICFIFAYKGRKSPKMYNETKFITFSMLVYIIVWISFGVVYVNIHVGKYFTIIESIAILASVYCIVCCHFLPTCYIVCFKKEANIESNYLTHAREHFKQKGQFVCPIAKMQRNSQISSEEQPPSLIEVKTNNANEGPINQKTHHTDQTLSFQNQRHKWNCLRKRHRSC